MSEADDHLARTLANELTNLERLVRLARGVADPLRRQIAAALLPWVPAGLPELSEMQAAWNTFLAAPAEVRNQILSGWPTPTAIADPEELRGGTEPLPQVARFAGVAADTTGEGTRTLGVRVWPDFTTADAIVLIREGTQQKDAIAAVESLLERLRDDWPAVLGISPTAE